jgi:ATP-dependent DNA helicase RecQ
MGDEATLEAARAVLADVFGYPDFRLGQGTAVAAVVAGRDAVVLLSTGSGKSLCYQVPAVLASRRGAGTTLVVSPLIALMEDQLAALAGRGVKAAALHSHQEADAQRAAVAAFMRGELDLLYVSPERAAKASFRRMLMQTPIALLAIDEAHCVSEWGHDFRPDYLTLRDLRALTDAPMVALTATATPRVLEEIQTHLALRHPEVVRARLERPNLAFAVHAIRTQAARLAQLEHELDTAGLRPRRGAGRAIVYCSTRKTTDAVAKALRSSGFAVGHYHAGRTKLARERAQQAFEAGRTRVLVATNAFGMGIDVPDIRLIVHFQTPGSVEAYFQEAGRAGRDGEPARCVLFFGASDLATQRRLGQASASSPTLERRREIALAAIEHYAAGDACREQSLVAHFDRGSETAACGRCDACLGGVDAYDPSPARAQAPPPELLPAEAHDRIVGAVDRLTRPVGKVNLARALRGSRAKSLSRGGLLTLPEYGTFSESSEAGIVAAIETLIQEGRLERTGSKYPTVWIPGKPVRGARPDDETGTRPARKSRSRFGGPIARELDNYRRRTARELKWKAYMVLQHKTILAIDRAEPETTEALARIPGLGPAKLERFGDDILDVVRRNRGAS